MASSLLDSRMASTHLASLVITFAASVNIFVLDLRIYADTTGIWSQDGYLVVSLTFSSTMSCILSSRVITNLRSVGREGVVVDDSPSNVNLPHIAEC